MNKHAIFLGLLILSSWFGVELSAWGDSLSVGSEGVVQNTAVQSANLLNLPNLGEPVPTDGGLVPTGSGALQLKGSLDGDRYLIKQDFTNARGALLDVDVATRKIPDTTLGWLVSARPNKAEAVMNLGWRFGDNQQILVSASQLRAVVESDDSNRANLTASQHTGGVDYRVLLGNNWLSGIDVSGYAGSSQSPSAQDSAEHLVNASLVGLRVGLEATPVAGSKLKIGFATDHLAYDSVANGDPVHNMNTSIQWSQVLWPTVQYSASVVGNGLQRNVSTGVDINLPDGQQLAIKLARSQSSDGQLSDNAIRLSYTMLFGNKFTPFQAKARQMPWNTSLMPEVLQRPAYLPATILSKPESGLN